MSEEDDVPEDVSEEDGGAPEDVSEEDDDVSEEDDVAPEDVSEEEDYDVSEEDEVGTGNSKYCAAVYGEAQSSEHSSYEPDTEGGRGPTNCRFPYFVRGSLPEENEGDEESGSGISIDLNETIEVGKVVEASGANNEKAAKGNTTDEASGANNEKAAKPAKGNTADKAPSTNAPPKSRKRMTVTIYPPGDHLGLPGRLALYPE